MHTGAVKMCRFYANFLISPHSCKSNHSTRVNFQLGLHFSVHARCYVCAPVNLHAARSQNKQALGNQPPPSTPLSAWHIQSERNPGAACEIFHAARFAYGNKSEQREREECLSERCHSRSSVENAGGRPSTRSFQLLREGLHTK